ncbi:hypothetical protein AB0K24_20760 [Streptomyces mirabilis]|uniref:hypothetical protein n=1 Tax=Streptomyces mirabilis TaxID=68239 RepID=UPI00342F766C
MSSALPGDDRQFCRPGPGGVEGPWPGGGCGGDRLTALNADDKTLLRAVRKGRS